MPGAYCVPEDASSDSQWSLLWGSGDILYAAAGVAEAGDYPGYTYLAYASTTVMSV